MRDAAITAARNAFAAGSYARTTFKGLAAAAGVAPTVLRKYYDSKDAVFAAALLLIWLAYRRRKSVTAEGLAPLSASEARRLKHLLDDR